MYMCTENHSVFTFKRLLMLFCGFNVHGYHCLAKTQYSRMQVTIPLLIIGRLVVMMVVTVVIGNECVIVMLLGIEVNI